MAGVGPGTPGGATRTRSVCAKKRTMEFFLKGDGYELKLQVVAECAICGKPFQKAHVNQKYCSSECAKEAVRIRRRKPPTKVGLPTTCEICGEVFIRKSPNSKYCSSACKEAALKSWQEQYRAENPHYDRDRWRKIRGTKEHHKICVICGVPFATVRPQQKACSEECRRELMKRHRGGSTKKSPEARHREWIHRRYGSEEAHQEYLKQKEIEDMNRKAKREAERIRKKEENHRFGECVVCGRLFETYNPAQKTCSSECGKKLQYARHQNRIPKNQIIDNDITLEALYRRDSGVCYLCGKPCDWSDKDGVTVGPNYPSIDHLIPVSRGGFHAWDNVRLAHFSCNVKKSDALIPEVEKMVPKNAYCVKREPKPHIRRTLQFSKDNQLLAAYDSTAEAERQTGIRQRGIQNCARGERKSYGGFVWKYA